RPGGLECTLLCRQCTGAPCRTAPGPHGGALHGSVECGLCPADASDHSDKRANASGVGRRSALLKSVYSVATNRDVQPAWAQVVSEVYQPQKTILPNPARYRGRIVEWTLHDLALSYYE